MEPVSDKTHKRRYSYCPAISPCRGKKYHCAIFSNLLQPSWTTGGHHCPHFLHYHQGTKLPWFENYQAGDPNIAPQSSPLSGQVETNKFKKRTKKKQELFLRGSLGLDLPPGIFAELCVHELPRSSPPPPSRMRLGMKLPPLLHFLTGSPRISFTLATSATIVVQIAHNLYPCEARQQHSSHRLSQMPRQDPR